MRVSIGRLALISALHGRVAQPSGDVRTGVDARPVQAVLHVAERGLGVGAARCSAGGRRPRCRTGSGCNSAEPGGDGVAGRGPAPVGLLLGLHGDVQALGGEEGGGRAAAVSAARAASDGGLPGAAVAGGRGAASRAAATTASADRRLRPPDVLRWRIAFLPSAGGEGVEERVRTLRWSIEVLSGAGQHGSMRDDLGRVNGGVRM